MDRKGTIVAATDDVLRCPCQNFTSTNAIYTALASKDRTKELIEWISGRLDESEISAVRLSCQPASASSRRHCANRVDTSFSILNDIRHACRDYLDQSSPNNHTALYGPKRVTPTKAPAAPVSYETSFPSLSSSSNTSTAIAPNLLIARKKPRQKDRVVLTSTTSLSTPPIQAKRRIRPVLATPISNGQQVGNVASLQSEEPLISSTASLFSSRTQVNNISSSQLGSLPMQAHGAVAWPAPTAAPLKPGAAVSGNIANTTSEQPLQHQSSLQPSMTRVRPQSRGGNTTGLQSQDTEVNEKLQQNSSPWTTMQTTPTKTSLKSLAEPSTGNITAISSEQPNVVRPNIAGSASQSEGGDITILPSQGPKLQVIEKSQTTNDTWTMQTPTKIDEAQKEAIAPDEIAIINLDQMKRLSNLYTTLIQSNLVPSTPLELHLLVGLLTVKDNSAIATRTISSIRKNNPILVSPESCRQFAVQSLTRLKAILGNLHLQVLNAFVNCPPVRELLPPDMIRDLTARLEERQAEAVETDSGFIGVGSTQPILTLPFHETRDSRHNYKSREASALYKNREESRDAFLYQLRHFQNVRGRGVMDTADLESALGKIRRSARNVISGVQVPNMHWFAEFFSDLLLQIGLVPLEETDKDLLKITDKDKLQKLHKRFSSKVGTSSKGSSSKMVSDTRDSQSPEKEAHQFFPLHQEFFFIFLQAADSYSFGVHLKSRLSAAIHSLAQHSEMKGFQDRLAKLQVLAKFLGVLLFSSNWHKSSVFTVLNSVSVEEAVIWTSTANIKLPLLNLIEGACNQNRILYTIPWILELLRMAKWDMLSIRSHPIEAIFLQLISLRDAICVSNEASAPNLQLVSLCLESFFHQVVGLRHTHALRRLANTVKTSKKVKGPDSVELRVSNNFLFGSISHIDELLSLLTSIATTRAKSSGTPRKMRPSIVSASLSSFPALLSEKDTAISITSAVDSFLPGTAMTGKSRIIGKLVDMFFHQHGDLKDICEFVADRAVQKSVTELQQHFLPSYLQSITYPLAKCGQESVDLSALEQDTLVGALKRFNASLESIIRQSVNSLSTKSPKINEIATTLTTDHAMTSANLKVHSLIRVELKKHYEGYLKGKEKSDRIEATVATKNGL